MAIRELRVCTLTPRIQNSGGIRIGRFYTKVSRTKDDGWFTDLTSKGEIMQHQLRNYEITKADYKQAVAQGTDQFARESNDTVGWRRQAMKHAPGFQISSALEQFNNLSTNFSHRTELTTVVKDSFKSFATGLSTARRAGIVTLLRNLLEIYSPTIAAAARAPEPTETDQQSPQSMENEIEQLKVALAHHKSKSNQDQQVMNMIFEDVKLSNHVTDFSNAIQNIGSEQSWLPDRD
jgi:hypothetical protein